MTARDSPGVRQHGPTHRGRCERPPGRLHPCTPPRPGPPPWRRGARAIPCSRLASTARHRSRQSLSADRTRYAWRPIRRLGQGARDTIPIDRARHPAGSLNPASMRSRSSYPDRLCRRDLTEASRFPPERFRDSFNSHQMWGLSWDHRSKSGKIDRLPSCVGWRGGKPRAGLRHGFTPLPTRLTGRAGPKRRG